MGIVKGLNQRSVKKMRQIDAENYKEALRNLPDRATKEDAIALLDLMPTVDPETLPIVKELRVQLALKGMQLALKGMQLELKKAGEEML